MNLLRRSNKSQLTRSFNSVPKKTTQTHTLENSTEMPEIKEQNQENPTTIKSKNQKKGRYLLMPARKSFMK